MESFRRRSLRRAAEYLGGRERLCELLDVAPQELAAWMDGTQPTPQPVLLSVLELLDVAQVAA